jgi:hypothetical protein
MADLRNDLFRLKELASFVLLREGSIPYFYNDNENYVTIGIGTLVKTREDARSIGNDANVRFTFRNSPGSRATAIDVVADWDRVHARLGLSEHAYANVAMLRLDSSSVNYLMMQEIKRSANLLYRQHPFLIVFDSRIAMALVDTRYNPAGINPYISPRVVPLWAALRSYDLDKALVLFKTIWAGRGGKNQARYQTRHMQRVTWFAAGVAAMHIDNSMTSRGNPAGNYQTLKP